MNDEIKPIAGSAIKKLEDRLATSELYKKISEDNIPFSHTIYPMICAVEFFRPERIGSDGENYISYFPAKMIPASMRQVVYVNGNKFHVHLSFDDGRKAIVTRAVQSIDLKIARLKKFEKPLTGYALEDQINEALIELVKMGVNYFASLKEFRPVIKEYVGSFAAYSSDAAIVIPPDRSVIEG